MTAAALIVAFWDEIKAGAAAAVEAVTSAFQVAWQFLGQGFAALSGAVTSAWQAIVSARPTTRRPIRR